MKRPPDSAVFMLRCRPFVDWRVARRIRQSQTRTRAVCREWGGRGSRVVARDRVVGVWWRGATSIGCALIFRRTQRNRPGARIVYRQRDGGGGPGGVHVVFRAVGRGGVPFARRLGLTSKRGSFADLHRPL